MVDFPFCSSHRCFVIDFKICSHSISSVSTGTKIVLFADDTNILVTDENINNL